MPTDTKKRTGRVYQLVNMITNEKYIGSTFQTLYKRQFDRRFNYNNWLKGKSHFSDNHQLFNNIHEYGQESFRIELLAEVEVNNKAELYKIEGDYIRKYNTFNNGLNGLIPNRDRKEYKKQYYKKHKEKIVKQYKQYRQNNKDNITEYHKQYQKNNSQKFNCTFCNYSTYHKSKYISHLNTPKHKFAVMY